MPGPAPPRHPPPGALPAPAHRPPGTPNVSAPTPRAMLPPPSAAAQVTLTVHAPDKGTGPTGAKHTGSKRSRSPNLNQDPPAKRTNAAGTADASSHQGATPESCAC